MAIQIDVYPKRRWSEKLILRDQETSSCRVNFNIDLYILYF
jgi:hypothetical protein